MIKKSKWVHLLQRMGGTSATPRRKDMKHQKNIVDLLSLNGSFKASYNDNRGSMNNELFRASQFNFN